MRTYIHCAYAPSGRKAEPRPEGFIALPFGARRGFRLDCSSNMAARLSGIQAANLEAGSTLSDMAAR